MKSTDARLLSKDESAVDALVRQIRDYIQVHRLGIADHLPSERELAERFDAARNTVREAIRILKAYGVIDVRPKVGAVIVDRHMDAVFDLFSFQIELSRETFLDIQRFRRLIEVGAVDDLFNGITDEGIEELQSINASILTASSVEDAARLDFAFHCKMLGFVGNKMILGVYRTMQPLLSRLMETGKATDGLEKTFESHQAILDALKRRDRLGYRYHMEQHLNHSLKYIDKTIR
jgi:DNA-binding FadR family transcriptional regulator